MFAVYAWKYFQNPRQQKNITMFELCMCRVKNKTE